MCVDIFQWCISLNELFISFKGFPLPVWQGILLESNASILFCLGNISNRSVLHRYMHFGVCKFFMMCLIMLQNMYFHVCKREVLLYRNRQSILNSNWIVPVMYGFESKSEHESLSVISSILPHLHCQIHLASATPNIIPCHNSCNSDRSHMGRVYFWRKKYFQWLIPNL